MIPKPCFIVSFFGGFIYYHRLGNSNLIKGGNELFYYSGRLGIVRFFRFLAQSILKNTSASFPTSLMDGSKSGELSFLKLYCFSNVLNGE